MGQILILFILFLVGCYITGNLVLDTFSDILEPIEIFGKRLLYTINEKNNNKLETPFKSENILIKRWWKKNKKLKGVDLTGILDDVDEYYKLEREDNIELAISSFILKIK